MELTPSPCVFLYLFGVFICLSILRVILGHLTLALSFVMWLWGAFPLLWIHKSKVSFLLFKFLLDLDYVPIGGAK